MSRARLAAASRVLLLLLAPSHAIQLRAQPSLLPTCGCGGCAPPYPLPPHAFAKEEPQEMSLDAGDFVLVLKAELDAASGWLFAEHLTSRSSGYVPSAYLAFVRDSLVMPAANAEAPLPALAAPTGIE